MNKRDVDGKLSNLEACLRSIREMRGAREHPHPYRNVVMGQLIASLASGLEYARGLWNSGHFDAAADVVDKLVAPAMNSVETERVRWMADFERLAEMGHCIYTFEAWNKTCGFACRSWAVTAQANAQRNCAIPTGDDQERETGGQIEETWVGESVYNRVRMGGKGGAVVSD